jgi:DNA (cytosine-5)-methyltransferase 1
MKFIDLFAGLGGFHIALSKLGMECVFASEINEELRQIYKKNHGILPAGDIRAVSVEDIPKHDVLCAGFPCQPFSSAGKKNGSQCPTSGKLIDEVFRIVRHHHPKYIFLENVPQIITIQNGEFWAYIKESLEDIDYTIDYKQYSPHEFGIPQQRQRVFVVAKKVGLPDFTWPDIEHNLNLDINSIIQHKNKVNTSVEPQKINTLELWHDFVNNVTGITSHTVLAAEFGATYPVEDLLNLSLDEFRKYKGAFGTSLSECTSIEECLSKLPDYLQKDPGVAPNWIKPYIVTSRAIYNQHKDFIDNWKSPIINLHKSWQKLEWRGDRDNPNIWEHLVQFRASGIRVMRPKLIPSLVAMTSTQVPIIGAEKRYLTTREAAALQAMETLKILPEAKSNAFKALGNAVNAKIINCITQQVLC